MTPALWMVSTTCRGHPDLPGSVGRSFAGGRRRRRLCWAEGLAMSGAVFHCQAQHALANCPPRYQLWPCLWKCIAMTRHEEFYVVLIGHPASERPSK